MWHFKLLVDSSLPLELRLTPKSLFHCLGCGVRAVVMWIEVVPKRVLSNAHAEISLVVVLIVLVIPESEAMVSDFDLNAHSIQVDIFLEEEAK